MFFINDDTEEARRSDPWANKRWISHAQYKQNRFFVRLSFFHTILNDSFYRTINVTNWRYEVENTTDIFFIFTGIEKPGIDYIRDGCVKYDAEARKNHAKYRCFFIKPQWESENGQV